MLRLDDASALIEVRVRRPTELSMHRWFVPATECECLPARLTALARDRDVYVGVAPRVLATGRRAGVPHAHVAWADVDGPGGLASVAMSVPAPTLTIASGSPGGVHAYWALTEKTPASVVEELNRRLACALGGDAVWAVTTILRPPGTFNHKHTPPRPVRVIEWRDTAYDPGELLARLPSAATVSRAPQHPAGPRSCAATDALLALEPRVYVARLLGVEVPRSGFVSCPFHSDTTPSLKVYETPERGWCCFGRCGRRGGTVYDLAARLWGLQTRGADFLALRARLLDVFPEARRR